MKLRSGLRSMGRERRFAVAKKTGETGGKLRNHNQGRDMEEAVAIHVVTESNVCVFSKEVNRSGTKRRRRWLFRNGGQGGERYLDLPEGFTSEDIRCMQTKREVDGK